MRKVSAPLECNARANFGIHFRKSLHHNDLHDTI